MRSSTAPPVSTTNAIHVEACAHSSATHGTSATAASPMAGTTPSACRWTTTTTAGDERGGVDERGDPQRVVGQPVRHPAPLHAQHEAGEVHPTRVGPRAGAHIRLRSEARRARPPLGGGASPAPRRQIRRPRIPSVVDMTTDDPPPLLRPPPRGPRRSRTAPPSLRTASSPRRSAAATTLLVALHDHWSRQLLSRIDVALELGAEHTRGERRRGVALGAPRPAGRAPAARSRVRRPGAAGRPAVAARNRRGRRRAGHLRRPGLGERRGRRPVPRRGGRETADDAHRPSRLAQLLRQLWDGGPAPDPFPWAA